MKYKWVAIFSCAGLAALILNSKTALMSAREGIDLCLGAVIPSLLPFFFLSTMLTACLKGLRAPMLRPVGRLFGIPKGCEPILLIGLCGGYPVGAQCIGQAYRDGTLKKEDARHMLAFCNNCGPAFIFGIIGQQFPFWWAAWLLWLIHVLSALLVAIILPYQARKGAYTAGCSINLTDALHRSIRVMAHVCGWIIIFRVLSGFLQHWFGFMLSNDAYVILAGILELTNGCVSLHMISDIGIRFLVSSILIALGGLCVTMQTHSVLPDALKKNMYLSGKLMQTIFSATLALMVAKFIIKSPIDPLYLCIAAALNLFSITIFRKMQKTSSNLTTVAV